MSVENIGSASSLGGLASTGARFFLSGAAAFADTLSIGQIIEGRVLRGFEDNRYLVAFGKNERVVDSSTPLTTGEILYGRVVGLGDRVEVQRVYASPERKSVPHDPDIGDTRATRSADATTIDALLQRYQVELSDSERAALLRAARGATDPEGMGIVGAMLNKLGLPLSGVLLEAVYQAQITRPSTSRATAAAVEEDAIPEVQAASGQAAAAQAESVRALSELLGRIADSKTTRESGHETRAKSEPTSGAALARTAIQLAANRSSRELSADEDSQRRAFQWLADRVLNAQTGGIVAHRSGMLPLLLGGQLVEISFALFEQQRSPNQASALQHRQVRFSLRTPRMGQVDVVARIVGGHVRVQINAGDEERTSQVELRSALLKRELQEAGWSVDELAYGARTLSNGNPVVRSVIEHVVSLDSLDRLV
jgi:hypothetical protein